MECNWCNKEMILLGRYKGDGVTSPTTQEFECTCGQFAVLRENDNMIIWDKEEPKQCEFCDSKALFIYKEQNYPWAVCEAHKNEFVQAAIAGKIEHEFSEIEVK